jgi:hypothetical protein
MNDDMPWVNLTQEEVEELRNKKHELTEYGKQKLRELMSKEPITAKVSEEDYQKVLDLMNNQEPYPDAMFEEAERREAERKALDAVDKLYKENGDALKQLAEIEKEEWERKERSHTVLRRYNAFYNEECSGLPHGTPITPEHMQAMALQCMMDALICENLNVEYNAIAIDDIRDLIARLYQQSDEFLERVRKNNETV